MKEKLLEENMFKDLWINGVKVYEPKIFEDERGLFFESYNKNLFFNNGITCEFVQDNNSKSLKKYTIRGLHFQIGKYAQAKLVRCTKGSILDFVVDLRKDSKTFLSWEKVELSENNKKMIFVPRGFAHGFITLEDDVEVSYKVDNFYNKENERTLIYNDKTINIDWGINLTKENVILSEKDLLGKSIEELDF